MIRQIGKLAVSIPEAGDMLGHGRSFTYELIKSGKLEAIKSGRRRLVVVESIERYVASLRAAA